MKKAILIDSGRIKRIHTQLAKIGMSDDKEYKRELVQVYTHGRETSTTGLFADEADMLIEDLQRTIGKSLTADQVKADQKRKLLCHYMHEMMWYKPPPPLLKTGGEFAQVQKPVLDMERMDNWCVKYGQFHKPLMEHDTAELSKLVVQFQKVHGDFLKSV